MRSIEANRSPCVFRHNYLTIFLRKTKKGGFLIKTLQKPLWSVATCCCHMFKSCFRLFWCKSRTSPSVLLLWHTIPNSIQCTTFSEGGAFFAACFRNSPQTDNGDRTDKRQGCPCRLWLNVAYCRSGSVKTSMAILIPSRKAYTNISRSLISVSSA